MVKNIWSSCCNPNGLLLFRIYRGSVFLDLPLFDALVLAHSGAIVKDSISYLQQQFGRSGIADYPKAAFEVKKMLESHLHMLSLYFVHYNFCRQHKSLKGLSPAMAAGVTDTLRDMEWICELIDARASQLGPRGPYKKTTAKEY